MKRLVNKRQIYLKEYYKRPEVIERRQKYIEEHKEQIEEYKRKYYIENKERITKRNNEYVRENRKRINEYKKRWVRENKDKRKISIKEYESSERGRFVRLKVNHNRRYNKNLEHNFTLEEWNDKITKTGGYCPICKNWFVNEGNGKWKLTIDHNPPVSKVTKGFVYGIENVEPICKSCNQKKGYKEGEVLLK